MKGIIKFCKGDDVVYHRVYNSLSHRAFIIEQYYTRKEATHYDSIVLSPVITDKDAKKIVSHLHSIGALSDKEQTGMRFSAYKIKNKVAKGKVQDAQGRIYKNMMEAATVLAINNGSAYQMANGKRYNRFGLKYIA